MDPRNPLILGIVYLLAIAFLLYVAVGLLLGPWAVIKVIFLQ